MSSRAHGGHPELDTVFGRTDLTVTKIGLGTGGGEAGGPLHGVARDEFVQFVRRAVDLGITYIDTAPVYGTESAVGEALEAVRPDVVLVTKAAPRTRDGEMITAAALRGSLMESLSALRTDYVDVFYLHAVRPAEYGHCVAELLPELERLKSSGAVHFIGITELSGDADRHEMLTKAADDGCWDAMMFLFNIFNQSARSLLLAKTQATNVAAAVMRPIRGLMRSADQIAAMIDEFVASGLVPADLVDRANPFGLVRKADAQSLADAAYRFAAFEPGCHVVLTGTRDAAHLAENIASIASGALPDDEVARLRDVFGKLTETGARS